MENWPIYITRSVVITWLEGAKRRGSLSSLGEHWIVWLFVYSLACIAWSMACIVLAGLGPSWLLEPWRRPPQSVSGQHSPRPEDQPGCFTRASSRSAFRSLYSDSFLRQNAKDRLGLSIRFKDAISVIACWEHWHFLVHTYVLGNAILTSMSSLWCFV